MSDAEAAPNALDRAEALAQSRRTKMARSAHAYVRGNTARFYEWLASGDAGVAPDGPPVWICGDCHVGNLGPLADSEGRVDILIRDLDQTVIGNPAHDLIRLGLSLSSAARGSDLPGVTTARMLEQMVDGYSLALGGLGEDKAVPEPAVVRTVRREAVGRRWRHLAKERIGDIKPNIPLGRKFWALDPAEREAIEALFHDDAVRHMVLSLNGRPDDAELEVVDAAYWMKGCSSLGKLRYAVLVEFQSGRGKRRLAMVDIKEAIDAVAPSYPAADMPSHNARRVVCGARALSPNLGDRMMAADLLGKPVVLRELMPQDLKLEIDQFTRKEAVIAARYLAYVLGCAHARQMDEATREQWRRELGRQHRGDLEAPHWLWSTVVKLVARHEEAYLEHCRRYALAAAA